MIQWASGAMGRTALRRIIDDPGLELAGLYVYSPAKAGLDAGEIARRPRTGVTATRSVEEILDLDADVVVHAPRVTIPYDSLCPDVERLLASGKNVVSIAGFHWPAAHGEAYSAPLLAACERGRSTLAGMGINPGTVVERLLLTATGMCASIETLTASEIVDVSAMPSPEFVFGTMGFNSDPDVDDITAGDMARLYSRLYAESLYMAAATLGTRIVSVTPMHAVTLAPRDLQVAAGVIQRGRVAATDWRWRARLDNGIEILLSVLWTADPGMHGREGPGHWTLEIEGRPSVRITMELSETDPAVPPSRALADATVAVAMRSVPDVVAAPPGFFAYRPPAAYRSTLGRA